MRRFFIFLLFFLISSGSLWAKDQSALETLSQVEGLIEDRVTCFKENFGQVEQMRICRKNYMRSILFSAMKGRGQPQVGRFLLCVRSCPIQVALCRGDLELGLTSESCDEIEYECTKKCLIDFYW